MQILRMMRSLLRRRTPPTLISVNARDKALAVLKRNGLQAFYYLPAIGIDDQELADALRFLGDSGFIITDQKTGDLTGRVLAASMTSHERAQQRRAQFRVV